MTDASQLAVLERAGINPLDFMAWGCGFGGWDNLVDCMSDEQIEAFVDRMAGPVAAPAPVIKDPADLALHYGKAGWDRALADAEPVAIWWARKKMALYPDADAQQVRGWLQHFAPAWQSIPDDIIRREVVQQLSAVFGLPASDVLGVLRSLRSQGGPKTAPGSPSFGSVLLKALESNENDEGVV